MLIREVTVKLISILCVFFICLGINVGMEVRKAEEKERSELVALAKSLSNLELKQYIEIYPSEVYTEEKFLTLWTNGPRSLPMDIHMVRGKPYRESVESFSIWSDILYEGLTCKGYMLDTGILILNPEEDYLKFRPFDSVQINGGEEEGK